MPSSSKKKKKQSAVTTTAGEEEEVDELASEEPNEDEDERVLALQAKHKAELQTKDDTIAAKSPGLTLLRSVKRAKASGKSEL